MSEFSSLRQQAGLSVTDAALRLGYTERTVYRWENGATPKRAVLELLRTLKPTPVKKDDFAFTFIDLFAGIGGLRKGFESVGGRCIFTSEWDRYSQKTYLANFPDDEHEIAGDITKVGLDDIPAHDLLIAGFPCQPFSIAGVSKKNALNRPHGFACETQGTLFFDVERIIAHHRPRAFVLENVKNLVNHDKGRTFKIIVDTLRTKLGYNIDWKVINAKGFVPQHRERIFIVGFRDCPFSFDAIEVPDPLKGPKLAEILHSENGSEKPEAPFTAGRQATVSDKYTLSTHLWRYLKGYAEKHKAAGNGFGFGLFGPDDVARTLSARYYKDGSEILIKQKGEAPRRLETRNTLSDQRGAQERGSLKLLVVELCSLWERETGEPVAAHGIKGDVYTSRAETTSGRFVTAAVEAMVPDKSWFDGHSQYADLVRAETFLPDEQGLRRQRAARSRQVLVIMKDFVARRAKPVEVPTI